MTFTSELPAVEILRRLLKPHGLTVVVTEGIMGDSYLIQDVEDSVLVSREALLLAAASDAPTLRIKEILEQAIAKLPAYQRRIREADAAQRSLELEPAALVEDRAGVLRRSEPHPTL